MADQRLTQKDLRTLLLWILIGVAGALAAFRYYRSAFPEAALDLRVSRTQAVDMARQFLAANGYQVAGYESSIVFDVDEDAKTYLERVVGLEQANRLMAGDIVVWSWDVRFFRPLQQEEFHVSVSPAGRVVGFSHTIEEARAGAKLERDAAQAVAEKFLSEHLPAEAARYELLPAESNSTDRPNRRDWSFTWERRGLKVPAREDGAPYRLHVTVLGDAPGGFSEFLKVPEAWLRDYQKLRSSNTFYGTIAIIPYLFLNGAVVWVILELSRRGLVRWRGALQLGIVLAILFFAMTANEWPITRAGYDTNSSYASFMVQHLAVAALQALVVGLGVSLSVVAAEPLYRTSQPDQLRLSVAWTLPGIRSKEFFRSCVIGLGMAAGHIGFVVLFYTVGSHFGVWAPQDIAYTDVISTALPWLYPLTIGVYASTSEEFLFRLFAIPFLMRLTKSRWLAVILPAFFWGFLHSTYPQEPGYIRGIEVGLIGIVAGVVMLRYGILATLVWHYTVDAALISTFLLRSGNLYFRVAGAVVGAAVLIPLLVSGAFYLARRRFEPDEALLNRAEPLVERPTAAAVAELAPQAVKLLTAGRIRLLLAGGAAGVLLIAVVKPQVIGGFLRFQMNARQAATQADSILRARGLSPERYHRVATMVSRDDGLANEFMRRKIGIAAVDHLYQTRVPIALWRVRYFRDGEQEEYAVVMRPDGSFYSLHHVLEEKTPGAKLSREDAQARAEAYLRDEKKFDLTQWKLMDAHADARPARTDHTFVWEEIQPVAGSGADAAHVRIEVKVQGDEVSGFRTFFKVPEEWERKQTERTLPRVLLGVWRIALFAGLGIAVLVLFFKNFRQQAVPWRRLSQWSLAILAGTALTTGANFPQILANYQTVMPLKTYAAIVGVSVFLIVLFSFVAGFFLLGLGWFFLARALGEDRIPGWRGMPAGYYRDALVIGLGGTATLAGLARLSQMASQAWPTLSRSLNATVPAGLDAYWPGALPIGGAISSGLILTGVVGLCAGFVARYLPKNWMRWGLLLGASAALVSGWGSPADFVKHLLLQLVLLGVLWFGVQKVVRFNLMGYFLVAALPGLVSSSYVLLQQPNTFLRLNGAVVVVAALALLAWPLLLWQNAETQAPTPGTVPPTAV